MPGPETKALFEEAAALGVGFSLGYAELTPSGDRFNSQILVAGDGSVVATFRKVHLPGHREHEPWRPFQHLERRYFSPGEAGFGVWRCFGGVVGMMICNDRRWPETYRIMGLQGVELILCGYNTPMHYPPDPSQDPLQGFHNSLVMQSGAYQNGTWVVGTAKAGCEEGVEMLGDSCIIAPSGQIVASAQGFGRRSGGGRLRPRPVRPLQGHVVRLRALPHDRALRTDHQPAGRRRAARGGSVTAVDTSGSDTAVVTFTVNGSPVSVRGDHPHLLAALREELDLTAAKDGCSPTGQCGCCTVLDRRQGPGQLPVPRRQGGRAQHRHRRRAACRGAGPVCDGVRGLRGAAVRFLHSRHRGAGQGPDRQEGCRPDPRGDGPAPGRPPVPVHRVREDPRRHRDDRPGCSALGGRPGGWRGDTRRPSTRPRP